MINLDTHILIYALLGEVTSMERRILESASWGVSAIVLWELAKFAEQGRLEVHLDDPDIRTALSTLHVWPLDLEVSRVSIRLDFAGDPADQLIAATSIVHEAPLLTRDPVILRSELVPVAT